MIADVGPDINKDIPAAESHRAHYVGLPQAELHEPIAWIARSEPQFPPLNDHMRKNVHRIASYHESCLAHGPRDTLAGNQGIWPGSPMPIESCSQTRL